jgi:hypothetical protein
MLYMPSWSSLVSLSKQRCDAHGKQTATVLLAAGAARGCLTTDAMPDPGDLPRRPIISELRSLLRVRPQQSARQHGPMRRAQRGPPWRLLVRHRAALVGACSRPFSGLHDSHGIRRASRQQLAGTSHCMADLHAGHVKQTTKSACAPWPPAAARARQLLPSVAAIQCREV